MTCRKTIGSLIAALALTGFACGSALAQDSIRDAGHKAQQKADPHKNMDHGAKHDEKKGHDADAQHAADPAMSPEQAAEMEAWMKAAALNENHERLNYFVGSWNVTVKSYMGGPDAEPMTSSGSSRVEWLMEGRFITDSFKGDFMGQPFQGMGITGYDNVQGHYVGLWVDNMGTGFMTSKGMWDEAKKTYTFKAEYPNPMEPGKMKKLKEVIKIVSDSEYTFTMYDMSEGEARKEMEITYKRS